MSMNPAQFFGAAAGGGMPMPSLSAGGGGPSNAAANTYGGGGFDGSGWAVNFGAGSAGASTSGTPHSVSYQADQYGLPNAMAQPVAMAASGGGVVLSPVVLIGAVLVLVLVLRKHA